MNFVQELRATADYESLVTPTRIEIKVLLRQAANRIQRLEDGLSWARGCVSICPDHGETPDFTSPLLKSLDDILGWT